jgi:thiamine pyrophosphokinase
MKRVAGVLAGADLPDEQLAAWVGTAQLVLAADGAADRLVALGRPPHVVIGDLDSIRGDLNGLHVVHLEDQHSTDCDKLLSWAHGEDHRAITLFGTEGDELDHVISTLQSSVRSALRVRMVLRRSLAYALRAGDGIDVAAHRGSRVSLLPLLEARDVRLQGVRWPLDGETLSPLGLTSVSNEATGDAVRAALGTGAALLFIERDGADAPTWENERWSRQ